jgi:hypothetical protein
MNQKVCLNHVALQCIKREKAALFFTKILDIPKVKTFTVSSELSKEIFGINKSVDVDVYDNGTTRFEIFSGTKKNDPYEHTCIEVKSKQELITRCEKYGLKPLIIQKEGKDLVFIKDFSNNLYEIKEKKRG